MLIMIYENCTRAFSVLIVSIYVYEMSEDMLF